MSEHLYGCPFGDYIDLLQLLRMFEEEHKVSQEKKEGESNERG